MPKDSALLSTTSANAATSSRSPLPESASPGTPSKLSSAETTNSKSEGATVATRNLYIPLLACEFKRLLGRWSAGAATDQERLYLVAICVFIRFFNSRFPVFGLVTSGPRGVISCAWNELLHVKTPKTDEHTPAIFIADQNAVQVDLRRPLDALNVATFAAYLMVVHAPRLRKLFEHVDHVDKTVEEYILDRRDQGSLATPMGIARSMNPENGKWHKRRASFTSGTKTAKAPVKKTKAKSVGRRSPSDFGSVPEEREE
ncbi:hypothetical protein C8Q80DRAFT_1098325 [Daedaleopsis nitida]|nr:hypothetical protein C8Q80DRAFT_1098325 [Daedaleopsis nitida]